MVIIAIIAYNSELITYINTPNTTASYSIIVSGSNYQVLNNSNSLLYQSQKFTEAFHYLFGENGIATSGSTTIVRAGNYFLNWECDVYVNDVTIVFAKGNSFTVSTALLGRVGQSYHAFTIWGNNVILDGVNVDCSGLDMALPNNDTLPFTNVDNGQMLSGIEFCGSNSLLRNSIIHNVRLFGLELAGQKNGAINNKIYDCGANGITFGTRYGSPFSDGCYAVNNEIWHCGDVGISSYEGYNSYVVGNYVHDGDNSQNPLTGWGGRNSAGGWGIGVEFGGGTDGKYAVIANNKVFNCQAAGIAICSSQQMELDNIVVSGNNVVPNAWVGVGLFANPSTNNIILAYNTVTAQNGIWMDTTSHNTIVYKNNYVNCANNIRDNGTLTKYMVPNITPFSIPIKGGFIIISSDATVYIQMD